MNSFLRALNKAAAIRAGQHHPGNRDLLPKQGLVGSICGWRIMSWFSSQVVICVSFMESPLPTQGQRMFSHCHLPWHLFLPWSLTHQVHQVTMNFTHVHKVRYWATQGHRSERVCRGHTDICIEDDVDAITVDTMQSWLNPRWLDHILPYLGGRTWIRLNFCRWCL